MAEKNEKLFDQFEPVSYETWRAKVETDLKGADFNKKLVWRTNEGFNVQPIYRLDDIKDLKTPTHSPVNSPMYAAPAQTMTGSPARTLSPQLPKRPTKSLSMSSIRA